ncbi:MAG: hypothetical protein GXO79_00725 [Chlorobi bacterium]|nr:hypothetical protein [Chlorobiota bacterium]
MLKLIDFVLNIVLSVIHTFIKPRKCKKELFIEYVNLIDEETESFINTKNSSLSFRNKNMLEWIINYPWIITIKSEDSFNSKYQFSSVANSYQMLCYKIYNNNRDLIAFIMLKERDRIIDIPYAFIEDGYNSNVLNIVIKQAFKMHAKTVTIYHKQLVNEIENKSGFRFFLRKMNRNYFATDAMFEKIKNNNKIDFQDGDGDCAFT